MLQPPQPPPPPLPASSTLNSIPTNPPPPLPLLPPPTLQLQHQPQNKHQDTTTTQANYVIVNEDIDRKQKQQTADVNEKLTKLFESINAHKKRNSIEKELNNETTNNTNFNRPFKITPLLICTNETKNNNKISITKNICNCNFCLLNLAYLNKNCSSHLLESSKHGVLNLTNKLSDLNLIDYIDLNTRKTSSNNNNNQQSHSIRYRSSTPQLSLEREPKLNANEPEIPSSKCLGDESIIYIDSIELDDHLINSNSNTHENTNNMNSFLAKLKSKQRLSTIFTEKNQEDEAAATKSSSSKSTGNHDYHVIDEHTELPSKVKLSPSNSVQSFEFIDHTQQNTPKCQLDETVKSYEKSWDDSATFLLEKLDKCLKQEQQQHLENRMKIIESNKNCTQCVVSAVTPSSFFFNKPTLIPIKSITPIKLNCSLREKKLNALRNLNCGNLNRKSFHGQACLANEMSNVNLMVNSNHKQALNSSRLVSFNG